MYAITKSFPMLLKRCDCCISAHKDLPSGRVLSAIYKQILVQLKTVGDNIILSAVSL